MKSNKAITLFLGLCMLALTFTGCNRSADEAPKTDNRGKQERDSEKMAAMGRYVERTAGLPELSEQESILGMTSQNAGTALYTFLEETEKTGTYYVYRRQPDGSWKQEPSEWLNRALGGRKEFVRNIRTGGENALYVWYFDGSYQPHIIKTLDESGVEEIKIFDFEVKGNIPNGFAVTGKGEIAVSYMGGPMENSIVLYDAESGSEIKRFQENNQVSDEISNLLDAYANKLAAVSEDGKGFTVYDTDTGEVLEEIKVEAAQESGAAGYMEGMIRIGENDDYYYLSPRGLGRFQSGGSIMEILIDGSLNTMGFEGIQYNALLLGENPNYSILFKEGTDYEFATYEYDSGVPTVPGVQLTMYGLTKNSSVSRAIGSYQKENPDVQITYYTAQAEQGAATTADNIRTLNTELLSKKGADILLLDGLPAESYIEKGVLADISDIVSPMMNNEELLENMTQSYTGEGGSIYAIPVRYSMPVLLGDRASAEAFLSLGALQQYAGGHRGEETINYPHRTVTYEELAEFILLANYKEIVGDGSQLDKAGLLEYLKTVQEAGKAMGATVKEEPKPPATEEDLKSIAAWREENQGNEFKFEFGSYPVEDGTVQGYEIRGIHDMMIPIGMQEQFGRRITSVNNLYIPSGIIGINSASKYSKEAKEFIRCVLSEDEQSKDMGGGLPVNIKALESYGGRESELAIATSYTQNGREINLGFDWPSKENIKAVLDMATTLTEPLNIDSVFKEMILNESEAFLEGSITAEKAAEGILNKAKIYLAE